MNKAWLKAALIRAIRTFFQVFAGFFTYDGMFVNSSLAEMDWLKMLSVSAVAAIYSIVTALAGLPEAPVEKSELDA